MNSLVKSFLRKMNRVIYNLHFWAIVFIVLTLIIIYYGTTILVDPWFPWFSGMVIFEYKYNLHGSLFLMPFLYAAVVFQWRGALIMWLLSLAVMLPRIVYLSFDTVALIRNISYSFIPLMVVALITLELRWKEKERKTLVEREAERQAYMSQVFKAQENERQRIAQELHDDTTQTLLVIANRAQALVSDAHSITIPELRTDMESIRDMILNVAEDMRRLSLDLRPSVLDNIGLVPTLRWLVDRLNWEDSIDTKIVVNGDSRKLQPETEVIIFRIVQEAVNNIRRHSKATAATITVEFAPESFKLTVRDNGKGFLFPKTISNFTAEGKLGLIGMQERAKFLNGALKIDSEPGKGTLVTLEVKG